MVMLGRGDWVWVDSDIGVPIGAQVKVTSSGRRLLVDDDGKEQRLSKEMAASLRVMHPTSVECVDDMIQLGDLTEASLLRNLQLRHQRKIIYTYIGSVLVAVNPYQSFPIYSSEQVNLYHGRKLGDLPPHIFGLAEACYANMKSHLRNHCCIISGESGAGKTESTKLILQYLAEVSGVLSQQQVKLQILESNPILEAFGNAKTIRNDNSSRFGKYLEIFFNQSGMIQGARVEQYLLEKSRVCYQAQGERNYHIFYCMLAGITAEERVVLSLGKAEEYTFLTKGGCISCEGRNDAKDYGSIRSAMHHFFSEPECLDILKLLAAILHLGNISFEGNTEHNLETSDVSRSEHFRIAASLLGVRKSRLASSLTHRSFLTIRDSVIKPLSAQQATSSRDALVKAIYNKLFVWIVGKINSVVYERLTEGVKSLFLSIGLLDIFGFENFSTNSFEQLCINFANETLQQFFVSHIFKLEQEEYLKEDVQWRNMKFSDNQDILELLAGKPCTLLPLIDEESHFPKGTDSTLLQKMNNHHSGNKIYVASKHRLETVFGIRHFAGVVYYDSTGFLEKNRDAVSLDLIRMLEVSKNQLVHQMFQPTVNRRNSSIKSLTLTPKNSVRVQGDGTKHVSTLSGQFRHSLDSLMKALSACHPFFIRCFKPNGNKQPKVFDRELCMRQLRYSGMMDTIHIRKQGYPIRHTFKEFLSRYRILLNPNDCNPKTRSTASCCKAICQSALYDKGVWKKGKTKIFLKDAHDAILERLREEKLHAVVLVIQRTVRVYRDRKAFLRMRRAAIVLQRNWRAHKERQKFKQLLHARKLQREAKRRQAAAVIIQRHVRGHQVRKDWRQRREAVILLQAYTRAMLVRRRMKVKSPQAPISPEEENQDLVALDLQQRLLEIVESQEAFDLMRAVRRQEEEKQRLEGLYGHQPRQYSTDAEEDGDGSAEFSFYKFSIQHFQGYMSHRHITQRLRQPLLKHDDEGDALACLTVWWIILRFMEDMPEPKGSASPTSSISRNMPHRRARKLSNPMGLDQKKTRIRKPVFAGGHKRSSSYADEQPDELTEDEDVLIGEGPTLDRPLSSLEKLHIIVGVALSRPNIRDEIYCQICKQLVENKGTRSRMQGWILLSVCLGIFPPTDLFMKYLEAFVRKGPDGYGDYCAERLRRLMANGERKEVPCWIELEAAKSRRPIDVSVALTDGRSISLQLDSASTSAEVCQAVADRINLRDKLGFSLFITFQDKTSSLGSCSRHVFDEVSQCEQEKDAPWRFSIRKEVFTPWHDSSVDPVSTDLIYRQVIKGIKSREYTCDMDEYVQLVATHSYIQFGSANYQGNVQKVVEECIPIHLIEHKSMSKWIQLISAAHLEGPHVSRSHSRESAREEIVDSACRKWPLNFSRFYEVIQKSGPPLAKIRFFVAVNWSSILFLGEGRDETLLELPYIEIKDVNIKSKNRSTAQRVSLSTVKGDFVLQGAEAEDMGRLIKEFWDGLRQRSVYALTRQDTSKPEDTEFLDCKQGDLLLVEKHYSWSASSYTFRATNQRTRSRGLVLKEVLQFLPTLSRPSEQTLELLSSGQKNQSATRNSRLGEEIIIPVSIKEFASEHFREGTNIGRQGAFKLEKLWAFSKEPLKQPLMKTLVRNSSLSSLACNAFTAILKYMGDYPIKQACHSIELTDQIFSPATQHYELRDEVYCQIMRQMTNNPVRLSVERGWQLMWLCSGLFPPSRSLMTHARSFLKSRPRDPLAAGCLQRMEEMQSKKHRKFPPHLVEVDAIQQNSTQIFHKIHYPNNIGDIFKVTSTTTTTELCRSITSKLGLSSAEGYGLYVKTSKKMSSLGDEEYFFDSIRNVTESRRKSRRLREGSQANVVYLVMMKRKLWFNVTPGKDLVADLMFHFPQELSKYLRGYHNCTKLDMTDLGGLLLRALVDSDRTRFDEIPKLLGDLVPADEIKIMTADDWKTHIIYSYSQQSGFTVQEAKSTFLETIAAWPTFGCTFFDVKQTFEPSWPNQVWVVINKQGVGVMNPKTKDMKVMYPFSRITEFHHKRHSFHMKISTAARGNSFVFESSHSKTMEDLLKSYISMYEKQIQAFKPRNSAFF